MDQKQIIRIENATLGYKKSGHPTEVIKNVRIDFYPGDFVGIVGLNGIGKSTLLKSLCGLLPLLSGKLMIDGSLIEDLSLQELARKISVVLTEKIGGFNLTAFDVVASGQMPYTDAFNRLDDNNLEIIQAAINQCGIGLHSHKPLNELSDGLFQKTIIAKALAQQTPVMLLDEPSAFLDYASKHDLFLLLKGLAENDKKCILVSSHDLDLLLKYCNKLLVISGDAIEIITTSEAELNAGFKKIGGGFI